MSKVTKMNYKIYARKSSESDDRQALSIESQISECKKIAEYNGITISNEDILYEAKSAKEPHQRPVFENLAKSIEDGKVNVIITWHPNRLSRNPIDHSRLIDSLDKGKLKKIITPYKTYCNNPDDKFFFGFICSQAKMENDNKSIDVKRGLRKKCEMGFPPNLSKIGYLNDEGEKGKRKLLKDPERFNLIKQLWDQFLTGKYSVRQLRKYANEVLGLTTVQRKKEGGKPLQLSHIYRILIDPFYAGFFYANDENEDKVRYEVNESIPRIITESQYWQAQAMLGRKGKSRPSKNKYSFVYSGKIVCGSCGGSVTAEKKNQLICSKCHQKFSYPGKTNCPYCHTPIDKMEKPTYLHYIYYHCIKKKNPDCPERSIQESDIDKIAGNYYEKNLQISPDLRDWCLTNIKELDCGEQKNKYDQRLSWEREKIQKEHEYDELFKMKMRNLIDEDEFLKHKAELKIEIENIDKTLSGLGGSLNEKMDQIKKTLIWLLE